MVYLNLTQKFPCGYEYELKMFTLVSDITGNVDKEECPFGSSHRKSRRSGDMVMSPRSYSPRRGDIVWLSLSPQSGHEQSGHKPALVLSPEPYNKKVGLAILCPITTQAKGYPFEVSIPKGSEVSGVILADQVKSLDWKARKASFCCRVPERTVREVLNKLGTLLSL